MTKKTGILKLYLQCRHHHHHCRLCFEMHSGIHGCHKSPKSTCGGLGEGLCWWTWVTGLVAKLPLGVPGRAWVSGGAPLPGWGSGWPLGARVLVGVSLGLWVGGCTGAQPWRRGILMRRWKWGPLQLAGKMSHPCRRSLLSRNQLCGCGRHTPVLCTPSGQGTGWSWQSGWGVGCWASLRLSGQGRSASLHPKCSISWVWG